ncbi:hypothetical protein ISS04_02075 [Candidatus Woesearchaeota archaeon]|nr:hypothetical protein [Candidatus Woesearchaeota archaeon]
MTRKIKKSLSCTKNLGTIKSKLLMIMFVMIIATPIVFGGTIGANDLAEYQAKCGLEYVYRQENSVFNDGGNSSSALNNLMNATPGNNHTVSDETVYNQMKYVVDRFRNPYSSSDCNDTCDSLGYKCDHQTICGVSENCGICNPGWTCNEGTCEEEQQPECTNGIDDDNDEKTDRQDASCACGGPREIGGCGQGSHCNNPEDCYSGLLTCLDRKCVYLP